MCYCVYWLVIDLGFLSNQPAAPGYLKDSGKLSKSHDHVLRQCKKETFLSKWCLQWLHIPSSAINSSSWSRDVFL